EMVGREFGDLFQKKPSQAQDKVMLSVKDLACGDVFSGISFDLHYGEILCMAGLVGARRTDVGLSLFGIQPATAGLIRFKGVPIDIQSARQAYFEAASTFSLV
ncbi:unnamed protein product, partial [marine sediment metagenome]